MKYLNSLLALSLAAVVFVPGVSAQVSANDYAPSQSPTADPAPTVPPPSLEHMPQQNRMGQGGGGQGRRGGKRGAGNGAGRAKMMARFDANGDGVLDDAERAKAKEWRAQHGKGKLGKQGALGNGLSGGPGSGPSGVASGNFADSPLGINNLPPGAAGNAGGGAGFGGGKRGPLGGGGKNGANAQARRQKMIQRFDTNGDGTLDAKEQASCDAFIAQRKQQRMMRMQQGGGGLGGPGAGAGAGGGGLPGPGGPTGGNTP